MINLFKRIRQQLLFTSRPTGQTGTFSKYLLYALGEIVLVVIGILIALQINNSNQNRLNEQLESQYLHRLLEDVREENLIVEATLHYSKQVSSHAKKAIAVFENSEEANPDPVENLINIYQASQLSDPYSASSTYKELIASGQINLLRNESLKTALIRYFEIEWHQSGTFNLVNNYRENLRGKMPDHIQNEIRLQCGDRYIKTTNSYLLTLPDTCTIELDKDTAKTVVENLRQDQSLKQDLRYLMGNEAGKANDLKTVQAQLDELSSLLEAAVRD